ncbi:MAG: DNA-directed RNA polymerase subunit alpha [Planctomycetes bacterium]|nr:DNA-directed RNA polymerase subunit alpha [Planctomycetota bacterium]MCB9910389.1 DNA-directed RNA polymerase subunit alpha [Planctomycetota bacterium]MCB9912000.1 DNA-directed RNA polymerase subunit alpha [Planctomycetota bacterium]HPF14086.1 DNA-directed RNA polymerase subunit alpha [Planctomycetota bacterium]HRV79968.1 DNA-directed RNA polymerase subunit alpha [Planctomycetota bacterium]
MRIRWRNFELPSKVQPDRESLTKSYGRFYIEPFERGFGHTIGTGLRRVLLSSISGAAVTSVRIGGANHEFDSLEGVYEDIADLILNLKQLRIQYDGDGPITCRIRRSEEGDVTGADVECPGDARVANPALHLCTLTMDRDLEIDLEVRRGRGYVGADENRDEAQELGTIPVDSIYSPVHRVRFAVEATRVGKFTNYDRLVLEVWTDGTMTPELALTEAAKIYRKHLNPFVLYDSNPERDPLAESPATSEFNRNNQKQSELQKLLSLPISELELSVRARNCLDGANLRTLMDVVSLSENEVMHLKNLGKTSLTEIKQKLAERGLAFGMNVNG